MKLPMIVAVIVFTGGCITPTFRTADRYPETSIVVGYWAQPYLDVERQIDGLTLPHHDYPKVLIGINQINHKKVTLLRFNLDYSISIYFMGYFPLTITNLALPVPAGNIVDALLDLKFSGIFPVSFSMLLSKNLTHFITPYVSYGINWEGYFYRFSSYEEYQNIGVSFLQNLNSGVRIVLSNKLGLYIEVDCYSWEFGEFRTFGIGGGLSLRHF